MSRLSFPTEIVVEGVTKIIVPKFKRKKGPLGSKTPVFYNLTMEFNRDISVLIVDRIARNENVILDGLAATGARGIRFANELDTNFEVVINDCNPMAFELIKKNIRLNKLENAIPENKKLNKLLSERHYDYIDIDPFGSPVSFLDAAMQSIKRNGVIGITATDTAPLCGTYPKTCKRRYGAVPLKTRYCHELGIRILIGFCVKLGAQYDLGIVPILSYSADHYFRVYIRVEEGANRADKSLAQLGYVTHNFNTGDRMMLTEPVSLKDMAGPLWLGRIINTELIENFNRSIRLGTKSRIEKYIELWKQEANAPPLFYDTNELGKLVRVSPPPLQKIIKTLRQVGFFSAQTHFSPSGFKTDAPTETVKKVVSMLSRI